MEIGEVKTRKVIKEIPDLKQEGKKVKIRFDPQKISILTCVKSGQEFKIIEDIEVQKNDGSWGGSYPHIKCFCSDGKIFAEALTITGEEKNPKLVLAIIEP